MSAEIVWWRNFLHEGMSGTWTWSTTGVVTLTTDASAVAIPLDLTSTRTIDYFEQYVNTGASTTYRCRIVTSSATTGLPTTTLVHADATATITVTAGAWNRFDFTNFSLAPGRYWIVQDSTTSPSTAIALHYASDYFLNNENESSRSARYWTGSAWSIVSVAARSLRARLKAADGWVPVYPLAPHDGAASGIDNLAMDSNENPLCRGIRFRAPAPGKICGIEMSHSGVPGTVSFYLVVATENCATELARVEDFATSSATARNVRRLRFPPFSVTEGAYYDVYVKIGSQTSTFQGVNITALNLSADNSLIECFGIPTGHIRGLSVHNPPTEGGSDVPTVTQDHAYPWVPVYSEVTASSGGGGETSHTFAA